MSTERGAIRKRTGSTLFTETAGKKVESPNVELVTIAAVTINGVSYLLASGATNLYSINSAREVSVIGEGFTAAAQWSIVQAPVTTEVAGQGPVYLSNGVDKPQYWTGAEKATKVKAWTGVAANPKLTDGVLGLKLATLKSKTANFLPSDIDRTILIETEVKTITAEQIKEKEAGPVVKAAVIKERPSSEEVVVELQEGAGWEKEYTAVHFKIERPYYEDKTSGEHVPNGKYMIFAGNHVWAAGMADDPSAVRYSETAVIGEGGEQADPSSWPKNNMVRFDSSDGQPITGIGTVGPYICVFKANKTWVIHDLDTGANRKLADTIGCVSHRSITETAIGTFFLTASQGVYVTEGSKLREMSYSVKPTIQTINPAKRSSACGAYFDNHFYLSFASGASAVNNRTLDFDVTLKSWWLHDLAGNEWVVWEAVAGEPSLYTIPAAVKAGVVECFVPDIYTDSGANYTGENGLGAWWYSPWWVGYFFIFRHRVKAPDLKKRLRAIFFNGSGEIIPLVGRDFGAYQQEPAVVSNIPETEPSLPVNFALPDELWAPEHENEGTWVGSGGLWAGGAETGNAIIYSPGVAKTWSVGWGNNSAEPFTVDAYVLLAQFKKS